MNTLSTRRKLCLRSALQLALAGLLVGGQVGCGVRTIVPIRYAPVLGAEKKVQTTDVLRNALKDRDPAVRAQAVALLGDLSQSADKKTQKAAAWVLGTAIHDDDPGVRVLALEKLGALPPSLGNKYLIQALRDANPFVREKVLRVLRVREGGSAPTQLQTATGQETQ